MKHALTKHLLVVGALVMLIATIGACERPQYKYMGKWDGAGNCVQSGLACAVISLPLLNGETSEITVSLR